MHKLAEAAGFDKWPHNALRHSFASYHLAKHGDATKTAFQMGNDPVVVHQSYKALVSNGDVERYWSLRPATSDNVVLMPKAANA
jgi:site-specific recombinase XerD